MKTVDEVNIERLLKNFKFLIENEKTFNSDKWKKLNDKYSPTKKDHFILENFNSLLKALPKARGLDISIDSIFNKQSLISFLEKPNILSPVNDNTCPRDQELQGILFLLNDILKNNINYEGFCFILFADSYSKIQNKKNKVFFERWNADLFKSFRDIYKESTELSDKALTYILSWYLLDAKTKEWVKPIDFAKSSPKKSCSFCNELIEVNSTICGNCKIDETNSQCPECHSQIEKTTKVCPNCNLKFSDYKKIEELNKDLFDFKRKSDWQNVINTFGELIKYWKNNSKKERVYRSEIENAKAIIESIEKEAQEKSRLAIVEKLSEDLINSKSKLYWRKVIAISEELVKQHKGNQDKIDECNKEIENAKHQIALRKSAKSRTTAKKQSENIVSFRKKNKRSVFSLLSFAISVSVALIGYACFIDTSASVILKLWGFISMLFCGLGSFIFLMWGNRGCIFHSGNIALALAGFFFGFLCGETTIWDKFIAIIAVILFGGGTFFLVICGFVNFDDEK